MKTPKNVKKQANKLSSPSLVSWEDSKSRTVSEIREDAIVHNEVKDTTATSELVPTDLIPKVSTPDPSSVFFYFQMNTPPSSLMKTIISISSIPPLPPKISFGISLPQISIPLSTPLFTDSTTTTTTTVTSTP